MKIEVNKSELAGALSALGKLVSRTSPVEKWRCLLIKMENGKIMFQTASPDEAVRFEMPVENTEPFCGLVNFDEFRNAVRNSRSKSLALETSADVLTIDGNPLPLIHDECSQPEEPPADVVPAVLPQNIVGLLAQAAPVVDRNHYRKVLQGIHFCRDGIIAASSRELLQLDVPLNVDPLTLPFPLALLATKCTSDGLLYTWAGQQYRYFKIVLVNWTWTGKALIGTFPNWKQVIPAADNQTHRVEFSPEQAEQLGQFLKSVPDDPPNNSILLSVTGDPAVLHVVTSNGMQIDVAAVFPEAWGNFTLPVNKVLLQRLLALGHRRIACGDGHFPIVASGGVNGQYVAMPLANHQIAPVQTNQPKEEKTMNEVSTPVVAAPMQPVAPHHEPAEPASPLDELTASIDAFRQKIKSMFDESNVLSRKVKEVALSQKQKERDFIQAKRVLERIRMAI